MINRIELHKTICDKLNEIYRNKNHDYGNAFVEIRKRYPYSINVRLWDKLMRFDQLSENTDRRVEDEKIEDTLADMANYCIMELMERVIDTDSEHEVSRRESINQ